MKKTNIGQRNQRISIESPTETKNEFGEPQESWQEFTPAWAKITVKSGSEDEESGRINSRIHYRLIIDFIPGIDESMRIQWNGKTLEITAAYDPDGMREVIAIDAYKE